MRLFRLVIFCPIKLSIFLMTHIVIVHKQRLVRFHYILTISLDKGQTKSFGLNILLLAIIKSCTTNQLFTICVNLFAQFFAARVRGPVSFLSTVFSKYCFEEAQEPKIVIVATSLRFEYSTRACAGNFCSGKLLKQNNRVNWTLATHFECH